MVEIEPKQIKVSELDNHMYNLHAHVHVYAFLCALVSFWNSFYV